MSFQGASSLPSNQIIKLTLASISRTQTIALHHSKDLASLKPSCTVLSTIPTLLDMIQLNTQCPGPGLTHDFTSLSLISTSRMETPSSCKPAQNWHMKLTGVAWLCDLGETRRHSLISPTSITSHSFLESTAPNQLASWFKLGYIILSWWGSLACMNLRWG